MENDGNSWKMPVRICWKSALFPDPKFGPLLPGAAVNLKPSLPLRANSVMNKLPGSVAYEAGNSVVPKASKSSPQSSQNSDMLFTKRMSNKPQGFWAAVPMEFQEDAHNKSTNRVSSLLLHQMS